MQNDMILGSPNESELLGEAYQLEYGWDAVQLSDS